MSKIENNKSLKMNSVLSLRKIMTEEQIQKEIIEIGNMLNEKGLKKEGCIVTIVHALLDDKQVDIEILVPLDKELELPSKYVLKNTFELNNAVYSSHIGNPKFLERHLGEMVNYINEQGFQQITGAYNVQITENPTDINNMQIDTYIGVALVASAVATFPVMCAGAAVYVAGQTFATFGLVEK